jgi:alpha/beta hydrolase fold
VSLHYVEAGDGPLIVLLHGFPDFWFGWRLQMAPLVAAAGFRVVAPDTRGYNLSSKPEGFEAYAVDLLAADIRALIGELGAESRAVGRSRLGRHHRLDDRDEPPGGGRPTRDPQCGPSAAASGGTAQPEPAAEVLVLLPFCGTGSARGRGARRRLALLPALPGRRETVLTPTRKSNPTSRRGRSQGQRPG